MKCHTQVSLFYNLTVFIYYIICTWLFGGLININRSPQNQWCAVHDTFLALYRRNVLQPDVHLYLYVYEISFPIPIDTNLQIERRCTRGSRAIVSSVDTAGRLLRTLWFKFRVWLMQLRIKGTQSCYEMIVSSKRYYSLMTTLQIFYRSNVTLFEYLYCDTRKKI